MNAELLGRIREFVADPTKAPMLHALLNTEAARVVQAMQDEAFAPGGTYSDEEFTRRMAAYEELSENLARAAALVAYWSRTTDERLIPDVVTRLANSTERTAGQIAFLELSLYPAVLALYGAGLGAVIGRREEQLAALLESPTIRDRHDWKPVALVLSGPAALDHQITRRLPGLERHHTPASDRLCEVLRSWVEELQPDQESYERAFDRWEYLLGLAIFDLTRKGDRGGYAPVGRFSWRGNYSGGIEATLEQEIASDCESFATNRCLFPCRPEPVPRDCVVRLTSWRSRST